MSLRVVRSVYYRDDTRWNYPTNQYPYNSLYCIIEGDGTVTAHGVATPLRAGFAYLIPPNTQFACSCKSHVEKLYVEFYAELLPGLDLFSGFTDICEIPLPPRLFPPYRVPPESAPQTQCYAPQEYAGFSHQLAFRGALLQLLAGFLSDTHLLPDASLYRFKPVLDDLTGGLSASVRIAEVAKRNGWHPATLSRAFHRHFGRSLKQYQEALLMTRLKQELLTTDKTLKQLAADYGFSDAYYLSAFFKRQEGCAPSLYRRQNQHIWQRAAASDTNGNP